MLPVPGQRGASVLCGNSRCDSTAPLNVPWMEVVSAEVDEIGDGEPRALSQWHRGIGDRWGDGGASGVTVCGACMCLFLCMHVDWSLCVSVLSPYTVRSLLVGPIVGV